MPFYGNSFSYDGVPSEIYNLYLSQIDTNAISTTMGSSSVEILSKKIYRRSRPYFYGATPAQVLKFSVSAQAKTELTAEDFALAQRWLFSSRSYKKLRIFQVDMRDYYFNAIFNSPEIVRVGNMVTGFNAEVECDSPFAYLDATNLSYTYNTNPVDDVIKFDNLSDDSGIYLYPTLDVTINNYGGDISITNQSDNNRIFSMTGLSANESVTIDNDMQIITSSLGLRRLSLFNKRWLRLLPGRNILRIQGNIAEISINIQNVIKKVGG